MALSTHVTDRFGTNAGFLRTLTNHDDPDAATVNTTRLGKAADAASGQFPVYAGVAYDDTDQAHIEAGVEGTIAYLRMWSSKQGPASGALDTFRDELRAIAKVSSRKRITPVIKSPAVRTDDEDRFLGLSPEFPTVSD